MARPTLVKLQRLKHWRVLKGWTQEDLAVAAGMTRSRSNIGRLETGGEAYLRTAQRLADTLGVELKDLLGPE